MGGRKGTGDMAQQLKALATKSKVVSCIPRPTGWKNRLLKVSSDFDMKLPRPTHILNKYMNTVLFLLLLHRTSASTSQALASSEGNRHLRYINTCMRYSYAHKIKTNLWGESLYVNA